MKLNTRLSQRAGLIPAIRDEELITRSELNARIMAGVRLPDLSFQTIAHRDAFFLAGNPHPWGTIIFIEEGGLIMRYGGPTENAYDPLAWVQIDLVEFAHLAPIFVAEANILDSSAAAHSVPYIVTDAVPNYIIYFDGSGNRHEIGKPSEGGYVPAIIKNAGGNTTIINSSGSAISIGATLEDISNTSEITEGTIVNINANGIYITSKDAADTNQLVLTKNTLELNNERILTNSDMDDIVLLETTSPQILDTELQFNGGGIKGLNEASSNAVNMISMGNYDISGAAYSQVEIGSTSTPTALNHNTTYSENIAVDTDAGTRYLAYTDDLGIWTTAHSNSDVILDNNWDTPYDTGVELEDATEYRVIISAMGGSITGTSLGYANQLLPVILNEDGTVFSYLFDSNNVDYSRLSLKGKFEFRGQISDENPTQQILFVNTLLDELLGMTHGTTAIEADRVSAIADSFNNFGYNSYGIARIPEIITTGTKLKIGVHIPDRGDVPTCNARMLVKVERMRGTASIT